MQSANEGSFNSIEYRCAMKKLDDLDVPRADPKNGEQYSIVGRINWLAKRNICTVIDTITDTNDESKMINGIRIVTYLDGTIEKNFYFDGECLLSLEK